MLDGFKNLSLSALVSRLHDAIVEFIEDIDQLIEENKQMGYDEIKQLRSHIIARLEKREEEADNKKILNLLDLFTTNKAVIELVKEDSEEWINLIEALEKRLDKPESAITEEEKEDLERIKVLTTEIKAMIRK